MKNNNNKQLVAVVIIALIIIIVVGLVVFFTYWNSHNNSNNKQTANEQATNVQTVATATPNSIYQDDWNYKSENMQINVEMFQENGDTFYVADVKIKDASHIHTAFANDKFSLDSDNAEKVSEMAKRHNAILTINGDYYNARDNGIIIRNGNLYVNKPIRDGMAIYKDGRMETYDENEVNAYEMIQNGVLHTFSFGHTLVKDSKAITSFDDSNGIENQLLAIHPRTAIGQIEPNHFILIVVDGRLGDWSDGMKLEELALEFEKRGCTDAYNLDGGRSSTMVLNDRLVNRMCTGDGLERNISDILYFSE